MSWECQHSVQGCPCRPPRRTACRCREQPQPAAASYPCRAYSTSSIRTKRTHARRSDVSGACSACSGANVRASSVERRHRGRCRHPRRSCASATRTPRSCTAPTSPAPAHLRQRLNPPPGTGPHRGRAPSRAHPGSARARPTPWPAPTTRPAGPDHAASPQDRPRRHRPHYDPRWLVSFVWRFMDYVPVPLSLGVVHLRWLDLPQRVQQARRCRRHPHPYLTAWARSRLVRLVWVHGSGI